MTANDDEGSMPSAATLADVSDEPVLPPADMHRALMARVAASRDRAAFAELFSYFGPRIKSLMLKAGAQPALAEDLVQEVMLTVWRKVGLYSPEKGTVSTWIFTIARNARIDRIRRSRSNAYQDIDDIELVSDAAGSDEQVDTIRMAARVTLAVTGLPHEQKQVVDLAFMQDKSQTEIAAELDLPLGTVKSRLRLAYGKLKEQLKDLR